MFQLQLCLLYLNVTVKFLLDHIYNPLLCTQPPEEKKQQSQAFAQ